MTDDTADPDGRDWIRTSAHGLLGITGAVLLLFVVTAVIFGGGVYIWQQHRYNQLHDELNASLQQTTQTQQLLSNQSSSGNTAVTVTSRQGVKVVLYSPQPNTTVKSPVPLLGQIPGNWSNEASFPVELEDSSGRVVASGVGEVLGDWMTSDLVPFSAKLTYTSNPSGSGTLVLLKNNPSGQASNADRITVPVKF